ncbi:MAG: L-seryl-tRNA(Sec) selenium transferase [Acidobacteria bacterium]|nr:MAG: L-seryl-tRNA(Sec) selenium transferase [Acidobacteriota bacterium]
MPADPRRRLPPVDRLLAEEPLAELAGRWSRRALVAAVREEIAGARRRAAAGEPPPAAAELARRCRRRLEGLDRPRPSRLINATGVVVHTNLGRVPLSPEALAAVAEAGGAYTDLEYDAAAGRRGSRRRVTGDLLRLIFPERGSLVVGNNAAAVLLALDTLARGAEVIVSRGELVEIGGSFRIPEILERSGAKLVEVGTTNRTHLRDYEAALTPGTGALLKVWPSNFRIVGFTREVPVRELARLAGKHGVPLVVDQGCGRLFRDAPPRGSEPAVEELLDEGADIVCFSGDKLLGGPQAGILVGDPELIERCAANPLARALRPGKLTLAALAATLRAWLSPDPPSRLPALRMLERPREALEDAARRLSRAIAAAAPGAEVELREGVSRVGGGAAPDLDLPTVLVAVRVPEVPEERLAGRLRRHDPPVVARVGEGALLIDPRTLDEDDLETVARAVAAAAAPGPE